MTDTNDAPPAMTGLEQLQALVKTGKRPGIAVSLDFDLVELSDGIAVFTGIPGDHAYNPINAIHGGYAATLLDSACGCAVHTKLSPTQLYTTLELKVSYLKGMTRNTGRVRAEGKVIFVWSPRSICRGKTDWRRRNAVCNSHIDFARHGPQQIKTCFENNRNTFY